MRGCVGVNLCHHLFVCWRGRVEGGVAEEGRIWLTSRDRTSEQVATRGEKHHLAEHSELWRHTDTHTDTHEFDAQTDDKEGRKECVSCLCAWLHRQLLGTRARQDILRSRTATVAPRYLPHNHTSFKVHVRGCPHLCRDCACQALVAVVDPHHGRRQGGRQGRGACICG